MKTSNSFFVHRLGRGLCALALLGGVSGLSQATVAPVQPPAGDIWQAVSNRTLDRQRGGFDFGGGLMVSFGLTRAVYINGELITQLNLNFGQLANITPARAAQISSQLAAWAPVQNGPGNTVQTSVPGSASPSAPGASGGGSATSVAAAVTSGATAVNVPVSALGGSPLATVIQNSLNNQQIIHQTVINATSNALAMVKSLNLQATVNEALARAIGTR